MPLLFLIIVKGCWFHPKTNKISSTTPRRKSRKKSRQLWFAFKFVFLYWMIHQLSNGNSHWRCCDLLSNLYFCIGWYTLYASRRSQTPVVICFQICIFVLGDTPTGLRISPAKALWFAFKFVFLYWVIHRNGIRKKLPKCCDLLSNLYFCIGWYTDYSAIDTAAFVVICFQICIFVLGDTPRCRVRKRGTALWFAFKFVFLYWVIHQAALSLLFPPCCDLLSNLYFCIGWYTWLLYP